jgi:hypothetical protein
MRGGVCRCLAPAYTCIYIYMYMHTHVCCPSCVRVRFPLLTAMDRHTGMVRYLTVYTRPALYAHRRTRVSPRRSCATYAPRRACVRALMCVCVGAPASAPTRASTSRRRRASRSRRAQAFASASAFNANIGAWNTASVTWLTYVCAASGPARTAADCARSVVDACAAVAHGGAADARAREPACACSYVDKGVCGWIADGHTHVLACARVPSSSLYIQAYRCPTHTC